MTAWALFAGTAVAAAVSGWFYVREVIRSGRRAES